MTGTDRDIPLWEHRAFEQFVDAQLGAGCRGCFLIGDLDRSREILRIYGGDTWEALFGQVRRTVYEAFGGEVPMSVYGRDVFAWWMPAGAECDGGQIRYRIGVVNDRLLHPSGKLPPVTVSVGAAFAGEDASCRELGRKARAMLGRVKEGGRCGCGIYEAAQKRR